MRLAFVHAESLAFETRRVADREAAETDLPGEGTMAGGVAGFLAVEAGDPADPEGVAAEAAAELRSVAATLDADRVALYPAPHLVDAPADAADAVGVLRSVAEDLRSDHEVVRVPVGYDTAVEVSWKGHPTSEGARRIRPDATADEGGSRWVLALPDGRRLDPGAARSAVDDEVAALLDALVADGPGGDYREALRRRELATARALSPRGTVVHGALSALADAVAREVGAVRVRPSPAVDRSHEAVRGALDAGDGDPVPVGSGERPTALDPGDLGVLSSLSGAALREEALPAARYARNERVPRQSGGDVRWVASPRITLLTADLAAARERTRTVLERGRSVAAALELDAHPVVRADEAFRDAHPEVLDDVLSSFEGPVPLELRSGPGTGLTVELGVTDGDGRFLPVSEVGLDPERAGRFGIELAGGGSPAVVSAAPVGDVERTMAALVAAASGRDRPRLPVWVAPTQVRLIPVAADHRSRCESVAETLSPAVRVDVDDRELPVGERIDRAREEWVPYVAVVGDRECERDALDVSVRASGRERRRSPEALAAEVTATVGDRPSPAGLPRSLAERLDGHPDAGE